MCAASPQPPEHLLEVQGAELLHLQVLTELACGLDGGDADAFLLLVMSIFILNLILGERYCLVVNRNKHEGSCWTEKAGFQIIAF